MNLGTFSAGSTVGGSFRPFYGSDGAPGIVTDLAAHVFSPDMSIDYGAVSIGGPTDNRYSFSVAAPYGVTGALRVVTTGGTTAVGGSSVVGTDGDEFTVGGNVFSSVLLQHDDIGYSALIDSNHQKYTIASLLTGLTKVSGTDCTNSGSNLTPQGACLYQVTAAPDSPWTAMEMACSNTNVRIGTGLVKSATAYLLGRYNPSTGAWSIVERYATLNSGNEVTLQSGVAATGGSTVFVFSGNAVSFYVNGSIVSSGGNSVVVSDPSYYYLFNNFTGYKFGFETNAAATISTLNASWSGAGFGMANVHAVVYNDTNAPYTTPGTQYFMADIQCVKTGSAPLDINGWNSVLMSVVGGVSVTVVARFAFTRRSNPSDAATKTWLGGNYTTLVRHEADGLWFINFVPYYFSNSGPDLYSLSVTPNLTGVNILDADAFSSYDDSVVNQYACTVRKINGAWWVNSGALGNDSGTSHLSAGPSLDNLPYVWQDNAAGEAGDFALIDGVWLVWNTTAVCEVPLGQYPPGDADGFLIPSSPLAAGFGVDGTGNSNVQSVVRNDFAAQFGTSEQYVAYGYTHNIVDPFTGFLILWTVVPVAPSFSQVLSAPQSKATLANQVAQGTELTDIEASVLTRLGKDFFTSYLRISVDGYAAFNDTYQFESRDPEFGTLTWIGGIGNRTVQYNPASGWGIVNSSSVESYTNSGLGFLQGANSWTKSVGSGPDPISLTLTGYGDPIAFAQNASGANLATAALLADAVGFITDASNFTDSFSAEVLENGPGGGTGLNAQQTRNAMSLASTAGTPAAGSIDADLDILLDPAGNGPVPFIFQVVDSDGNPLYNCAVRVYLDSAMTAQVAATGTQFTDQDGEVVYYLPVTGTYWFFMELDGVTFTPNPIEEVVS